MKPAIVVVVRKTRVQAVEGAEPIDCEKCGEACLHLPQIKKMAEEENKENGVVTWCEECAKEPIRSAMAGGGLAMAARLQDADGVAEYLRQIKKDVNDRN